MEPVIPTAQDILQSLPGHWYYLTDALGNTSRLDIPIVALGTILAAIIIPTIIAINVHNHLQTHRRAVIITLSVFLNLCLFIGAGFWINSALQDYRSRQAAIILEILEGKRQVQRVDALNNNFNNIYLQTAKTEELFGHEVAADIILLRLPQTSATELNERYFKTKGIALVPH